MAFWDRKLWRFLTQSSRSGTAALLQFLEQIYNRGKLDQTRFCPQHVDRCGRKGFNNLSGMASPHVSENPLFRSLYPPQNRRDWESAIFFCFPLVKHWACLCWFHLVLGSVFKGPKNQKKTTIVRSKKPKESCFAQRALWQSGGVSPGCGEMSAEPIAAVYYWTCY